MDTLYSSTNVRGEAKGSDENSETDSSRIRKLADFPAGPVAKTPHSQCKGPGFDPWTGNWIPHAATKSSPTTTKRSHLPQTKQKVIWCLWLQSPHLYKKKIWTGSPLRSLPSKLTIRVGGCWCWQSNCRSVSSRTWEWTDLGEWGRVVEVQWQAFRQKD